ASPKIRLPVYSERGDSITPYTVPSRSAVRALWIASGALEFQARSETKDKETSSVASTLLAVDDSVTMRKVLEITFAGPDFRVVTANSPDAAMQKLKGEKVDLVIADVSLEPMNGYDLCKAIKKASPSTPVM